MVGDLTPRLEKLSLVERTRTTSPKKCWCECPPGARSRATCAYCSAETASSSPQPCSPAALTQPSSGEDESDENGCPGSPLPVHPRGSEAGVEATPPPPSEPKTVSAREREPARIASSGPLRLSYLVPLTCGCRTKRDEPCSRSTANARRTLGDRANGRPHGLDPQRAGMSIMSTPGDTQAAGVSPAPAMSRTLSPADESGYIHAPTPTRGRACCAGLVALGAAGHGEGRGGWRSRARNATRSIGRSLRFRGSSSSTARAWGLIVQAGNYKVEQIRRGRWGALNSVDPPVFVV
ncbi:hypothetical protein GLOTRDRAFT_91941 [Gloeophyllum trabeum ATCC 11539]|uniref:Uncharacterized protein n=1 Tax=Gloeophyllum trabeum (strain ATCC 11539 / FP-39264 / Madison 617) TaxID=670483 RepID=S7QH50_GLOTA|nr:uncharacterized protein GLOTRDRAFT_91941 [Gloeophyllum trabeum ATCC 11539]EPQ58568.1 hypothetical protein GLOTRDRAFT_91941 [Gloeophyllum trabeum ATCC 11539]